MASATDTNWPWITPDDTCQVRFGDITLTPTGDNTTTLISRDDADRAARAAQPTTPAPALRITLWAAKPYPTPTGIKPTTSRLIWVAEYPLSPAP